MALPSAIIFPMTIIMPSAISFVLKLSALNKEGSNILLA